MAEATMDDQGPNSSDFLASVSNLKSATDLVKKLRQIKSSRSKIEREWRLNLAFFKGNQWVYYNRFSGRIESLPVDDGDKPRYRVRIVSNQILPGVQAYIAMLTKTKPVIAATPDSGSDRDIKAAQMAERLYEFWWQDLHMKTRIQEALSWATIAGTGYWCICWDKHAGSSMTMTYSPDGKPILHDGLKTAYKDELEQAGLPPDSFDKKIYMGDIRVDVIPPFNVYLDPTVTSFDDAKYCFIKYPMSPDEIKSRYNVTLKADAVPTDPDIALPFANTENKTEPTVRNVYIGYFKPTGSLPKGRIVAFCEGPDKILSDTPWDLPVDDLPLVKFPGVMVPGSIYDEALVTHARPLQKDINRTLSQIVEHKNLTVKAQMMAPAGSLRQRLTNEPGAVFEYSPINNLKPEWRDMPALQPYIFEHLKEMQMRMDRLFNLQAVTQGNVPPNVEAGVAIDLLQEAAVDQVSPIIQRMEDSLAHAGQLMVSFAQKYYTEPRLLKIKGEGGSTQVKKFLNADLHGSYSFHAEAGSGLPRSRAGRYTRIEQLVTMGVIRPDQAAKYLDVADLTGLQSHLAADEDQAFREHDMITEGRPVNPLAIQEAMQAVQQGMNPDTGQPLTGQEDPQMILHNAGLQPLPWENFQQHMDTHALYMKTSEFEQLPPNTQADFKAHFMNTLTYYRSLPVLPDPQAVRATMQLKGTVDPETAAEILNRAGVIKAEAQNLAQPPLDTWVTNDISKTDADSGNTHLDDLKKVMDMQAAQQKHELDVAKTQHQMELANMNAAHAQSVNELKLQQQQEQHDVQLSQTQQQHQQKLTHTEQMQHEKIKQARKPKPKPKSGG